MKILIADSFDAALPKRLARFGEVLTDAARLAEAEVLLVRSKTKVTAEYLAGAPALKLVIRGGVGLDNIDAAAAKARGITVKNTPAASSVAVAELVFAMMLASIRHLVPAHQSTSTGGWEKKAFNGTELFGKTLGLVGIGRIGTEVALRARAFGMNVVAYDPFVKSHEIARLMGLDELLAAADFISLHLPLTDESRGMVNTAFLGKMKKTAILVNTARGKCVNESDLAEALKNGVIRGAALDVFVAEPPVGSPLLGAPRLLMLPHVGASTDENMTRIGDIVVELLDTFAAE